MSDFCWSFILGISDDLFSDIRKIVLMMIKIMVIIIINRMLADTCRGPTTFHAIGFVPGTSFEPHGSAMM